MRTRLVTLAVLAGIASLAGACGVVGNSGVERISPPGALTGTLPASTEPSTTLPATSTSGLATTTAAIQTESVRLYFITSGRLTYVATPLASPVSLAQIVAALQAGPPEGALGQGLRSALPPSKSADDSIHADNNNAGVAVVELPRHFFDNIAVSDQRLVIAQIVLTLTDSRGIGQVTFNETVPKPSGEPVAAGIPLSKADFQSLLDSSTGANASGNTATPTTPPTAPPPST